MRQRNRSGSIGFDARIKTWHFVCWENGKRRSKRIGSLSQYPTKASAWRAAKPLRDAVENQTQVNPSATTAPTVNALVEQYRAEKMATSLFIAKVSLGLCKQVFNLFKSRACLGYRERHCKIRLANLGLSF